MLCQETRQASVAMQHYQEALTIQRVVMCGEDHRAMATCHDNIGNLLKDKKDLEGAMAVHEEAPRTRLSMSKDKTDTAVSFNNIGQVHERKEDHKAALGMYEKAYAFLVPSLGKAHSTTRSVARNIERKQWELAGYSNSWRGLFRETASGPSVEVNLDGTNQVFDAESNKLLCRGQCLHSHCR